MERRTMMQARSEAPPRTTVLKALLICGILSAPLYIASHVLGRMRLAGYSHIDQMMSELSAVGAPTRPLVMAFGIVYDALVVAFGIGVWRAAGKKRSMRVAAIALVAFGVIGLSGWFFPMNPRGAEMSATDVAHIVFGFASVLSMVLFIGFGSGADGRWFRIYSILTILATLVAGAWTGTQAARIAAGLPTPWGGEPSSAWPSMARCYGYSCSPPSSYELRGGRRQCPKRHLSRRFNSELHIPQTEMRVDGARECAEGPDDAA